MPFDWLFTITWHNIEISIFMIVPWNRAMEPYNSFFHCTVDFFIFNHSKCYYRTHSARNKWTWCDNVSDGILFSKLIKQIDLTSCQWSILVSYKTNNECFHSCNGKNIFIRWEMECSNVQRGEAELTGTFYLSPHKNILTIALINIHYLYINPIYRKESKYRVTYMNVYTLLICSFSYVKASRITNE